jgi:hypothetical protein
MPRAKSKASQGGLTPPKLYDSGLDFPNRGRKTRKRRQVRISCIFVAHYFCARVKSRIVTSSVYHRIPSYTLIAYCCIPSYTIAYHRIRSYISISIYKHINISIYKHINISIYKHINIYKYSNISIFIYKHISICSCTPSSGK